MTDDSRASAQRRAEIAMYEQLVIEVRLLKADIHRIEHPPERDTTAAIARRCTTRIDVLEAALIKRLAAL